MKAVGAKVFWVDAFHPGIPFCTPKGMMVDSETFCAMFVSVVAMDKEEARKVFLEHHKKATHVEIRESPSGTDETLISDKAMMACEFAESRRSCLACFATAIKQDTNIEAIGLSANYNPNTAIQAVDDVL